MDAEVLIVGAGIAGLSCARALAAAGRQVVVVDRARGVGGRCATRRIAGQPVDTGVPFAHGTDPDFLAALRELPEAERVEGWPHRVIAHGPSCSPRVFAPGEDRLALRDGMTAFPKALARGLDLRLERPVERLGLVGDAIEVHLGGGEVLAAPTVVLAAALEQSRTLLAGLDAAARGLGGLLRLAGSAPSVAVAALYPLDAPVPDFDLWHPDLSHPIATVVHDSAKRAAPAFRALVFQARPGWAAPRLDDPPEAWARDLLDAAAALLGPWARAPLHHHAQRWRFARVESFAAFRAPVLTRVGRARLGLTGEAFDAGSGLQGAYRAGLALARRLQEE